MLKAVHQRDGCCQIEGATRERGVDEQARLRNGERGFF